MQTPSPPPSRRGHINSSRRYNGNQQQQQLIQQNNNGKTPSRFAIEDMISSQGSLRRDMMRNDETVQAVRSENIMLAEKVQHATNLYRQLLGRVTKTEDKMDMEHKSMANIVSQAKQVELQIVSQQEGLISREAQLVMHLSKLQEEVSILKTEREQTRKQNLQNNQELRQLQEKVARQSSTLSNGLQDLKAHLDNKDSEKTQAFNLIMNDLRERVENEEHTRIMSVTHMEGALETLKVQVKQNEKQRQEDMYNMATLTREKEALAKADIRRLQEKFRDIFDEFNKSLSGKDGKLRSDLEGRVLELERKLTSQKKATQQKVQDIEEEAEQRIKELKDALQNEIDNFRDNMQNQDSSNDNKEVERMFRNVEKQITTNKKDIEKVVRAEISSRLTQGEKLTHQMNQVHKDHSEGLTLLQQALHNHKRKQDQTLAEKDLEVQRLLQQTAKDLMCTYDEKRVIELEKKMEDVEDALDEFAKQDERIELNSESIKHIEMENILAQGDIQNAIEVNTKHIKQVENSSKDTFKQIEKERNKPPRPSTAVKDLKAYTENMFKKQEIIPSQISLLERKLRYLGESFDDYTKKRGETQNTNGEENAQFDNKKVEEMNEQIEQIQDTVTVLKKVLTSKITDEHSKNKTDKLLIDLKKQLDALDKTNDDEEDDDEEEEDDEDKEKEDLSAEEGKSDDDEEEEEEEESDEEEDEESDEDEDDDDDNTEEEGVESDGNSTVLDMALSRKSKKQPKKKTK